SSSCRTLGGKEWVEYAFLRLWCYADPLVGEPDEYFLVTNAGLDKKATSRQFHCVQRVEYDVDKDLAQLRTVCHQRSHTARLEIYGVVDAAGSSVILPSNSSKFERIPDQLVHVYGLEVFFAFADREIIDPAHHCRAVGRSPLDDLNMICKDARCELAF